jgi:hypothetical protein
VVQGRSTVRRAERVVAGLGWAQCPCICPACCLINIWYVACLSVSMVSQSFRQVGGGRLGSGSGWWQLGAMLEVGDLISHGHVI